MNLLYIVSAKEHLELRAQSILLHHGCHTRSLVGEEKIADLIPCRDTIHLVSLFASPGTYENEQLCIVLPHDERNRGQVTPPWAIGSDTLVALKACGSCGKDAEFRKAILAMHQTVLQSVTGAPGHVVVPQNSSRHQKEHGAAV